MQPSAFFVDPSWFDRIDVKCFLSRERPNANTLTACLVHKIHPFPSILAVTVHYFAYYERKVYCRDSYVNELYPCGTAKCNHCRRDVTFDELHPLFAVREMDTGGEPLHGGGLTCSECVQGFDDDDKIGGGEGQVRMSTFMLYALDEIHQCMQRVSVVADPTVTLPFVPRIQWKSALTPSERFSRATQAFERARDEFNRHEASFAFATTEFERARDEFNRQ